MGKGWVLHISFQPDENGKFCQNGRNAGKVHEKVAALEQKPASFNLGCICPTPSLCRTAYPANVCADAVLGSRRTRGQTGSHPNDLTNTVVLTLRQNALCIILILADFCSPESDKKQTTPALPKTSV